MIMSLATFTLSAFIGIATPGPTVLLALANGSRLGVRRASFGMMGAVLADFVLIGSVAVGLGALLAASEFWFVVLKWVGVGYLAFLVTVDVPMYLSRWRAGHPQGKLLGLIEGMRDVSTRWVVTHDITHWKGEIAWMSLYFSAAVWASLALCAFYSFDNHLLRYRTEAAVVSWAAPTGAPSL